jgi:hypothetical protein
MIRRTGVVTGWLKAGFAIDPYDALLSATGATHGNVFRLFPAMTRPGQDRLGPERRVGLLAGLGAEHCQLPRRRLAFDQVDLGKVLDRGESRGVVDVHHRRAGLRGHVGVQICVLVTVVVALKSGTADRLGGAHDGAGSDRGIDGRCGNCHQDACHQNDSRTHWGLLVVGDASSTGLVRSRI